MSFLAQSFVPVYSSQPATELGSNSMIIGGSTMFLYPGEIWPTCATCGYPLVPLVQLNVSSENTPASFRALIPAVLPAGESSATMVQLFVCPEDDCYDTSTIYSTDTRSWVVRVATVPLAPMPAPEPLRAEARAKIEQGPGFLPARLEDSEKFYASHEPKRGLKLLGHSVRGKYYCSDDDCPQEGPHVHPSRRQLIQIGDRHCDWEEDEALGMMVTLGNTWIEQCIDHPEVLTLTMSGDW
ncbi:hypothetical protein FB451DRAFT_1413488 [Mycena latifolia]|nr:hypothetical protein FB451DRAFT_1413488 [Mycena latifolia]